jgi:hypothetical protein
MSPRQRPVKPTRKRLSLKEKISVIEHSASMSIPQLVTKFDSGFSTIYNILKKINEIDDMKLSNSKLIVFIWMHEFL